MASNNWGPECSIIFQERFTKLSYINDFSYCNDNLVRISLRSLSSIAVITSENSTFFPNFQPLTTSYSHENGGATCYD